MRLVHRHERDADAARGGGLPGEREEARVGQALRGDVHDPRHQPSDRRLSTGFLLRRGEGGVEELGRAPASLRARTWSPMSETSGLTTKVMPGSTRAGTW